MQADENYGEVKKDAEKFDEMIRYWDFSQLFEWFQNYKCIGFSNYESFTITILSPNVVTDRTMSDMEKVAIHELVHMMFDGFTNVPEDDAEPWLAEGIAILYAEQTKIYYISSSDYPKVMDLIGFDNFVDNQGYDYAGIYVWYFIKKFGFGKFIEAYRDECEWQELIYEGFESDAIDAYIKYAHEK